MASKSEPNAESAVAAAAAAAAAGAAAANGPPLRIFGYGSLIWRPGFPYSRRIVGCAPGYKRRFYQGSVWHRGTSGLPGRVATLLPDPGSCAWGVLYEVRGARSALAAMAHLSEREARLGGYRLRRVAFRPLSKSPTPSADVSAFTYVAEPGNPRYLGKASLDQQARQVAMATGWAGANAEYVRRVARFMAGEVPDGTARDRHIAELARLTEGAIAEMLSPLTSSSPSPLHSLSPSPSPSSSLSSLTSAS